MSVTCNKWEKIYLFSPVAVSPPQGSESLDCSIHLTRPMVTLSLREGPSFNLVSSQALATSSCCFMSGDYKSLFNLLWVKIDLIREKI